MVALQPLEMAEVRQLQLGILGKVDDLCRAEGITYYLAWGTLLGAIRHGGYIPWDDDIDIMMHREDYDRFHQVFAGSDSTNDLSLISFATDRDWNMGFAKISDKHTVVHESFVETVSKGVNIDLFPVDVFPSSGLGRGLHSGIISALRALVNLKTIEDRAARSRPRTLAVKLAQWAIGRVTVARINRALGWYASLGIHGPSERVGIVSGPSVWDVDAQALGAPVVLQFEGCSFLAPNDPDIVLGRIYGDYMRLPPEADRHGHRFQASRLVPG